MKSLKIHCESKSFHCNASQCHSSKLLRTLAEGFLRFDANAHGLEGHRERFAINLGVATSFTQDILADLLLSVLLFLCAFSLRLLAMILNLLVIHIAHSLDSNVLKTRLQIERLCFGSTFNYPHILEHEHQSQICSIGS